MRRRITGISSLLMTMALLGTNAPNLLAQTAPKKPKTKTAVSAVKYKAHCGMIYSAAEAKKNHYVCPMDHKPLVKMTSAKKTGK